MSFGSDPDAPASVPPRRRRRRGVPWPLVFVVLLALGLLAYCTGPTLLERLRGSDTGEVAPSPAPAEPEPPLGAGAGRAPDVPPRAAEPDFEEPPSGQEEEAPAEPTSQLPPLTGSDAWVREQVTPLSDHAALSRWLRRSGLVDLFVVAVDNVAEGVSPRKHLSFLRPAGSYQVLGAGDRLRTDPASYRRYGVVVEVVSSLDADACARVYRLSLPLFQESHAALGYPGASFHEHFVGALRELLAAPIPPPEPALEERVGRYVYADPALEKGLSDAQKQLLRMGPRGVRVIQEKLREIAAALEIDVVAAARSR